MSIVIGSSALFLSVVLIIAPFVPPFVSAEANRAMFETSALFLIAAAIAFH